MPVYEYKCGFCGDVSDFVMSVSGLDYINNFGGILLCQSCNAGQMYRYFGNQSVQFTPPLIEFHDIGAERMITSKRELKEIEKREGKVFGGHEELSQEARKNKLNNQRQAQEESNRSLEADVARLKKKWGGY